MPVQIIPAQVEHAEAIARIGASTQRPREIPDDKLETWSNRGFLTYSKPVEEARELIRRSAPYSYVAVENERVIGYLLVYDRTLCEELYTHPKGIPHYYETLLKIMEPHDLYIEQLSRDPEAPNKGIATELHNTLVREHPNRPLLAGLVWGPRLFNRPSRHFFEDKQAYQLVWEGEEEGLGERLGLRMYKNPKILLTPLPTTANLGGPNC